MLTYDVCSALVILLLVAPACFASPLSLRPAPPVPLPPPRLFSTPPNGTFAPMPPMTNPNPPIHLTAPSHLLSPLSPPPPPLPVSSSSSSSSSHPPRLPRITHISPSGHFIDSTGRTRLLRGMAVSYKLPPYVPALDDFDPVHSFAEDDLRLFDKLNLNLVRLGVPWSAVQPRRGPDGFDTAYLARVRALVEQCAERGIYVIVEAHQDLFAEKFMGDGMPSWAITRDFTTLPFPLPMGFRTARYDSDSVDQGKGDERLLGDERPTNMNYSDGWGTWHGADAVTRAFWGLYVDYGGVRSEFERYWAKVAETFKGMDNVIGYELLNEPFIAARSTFTIPMSWLTRSTTERSYLQPLYTRLTAAIRAHDPDALIFYEPVCGSGGGLGEGFTAPPDQPDKTVFSFHSYGPNPVDTLSVHQAVRKAKVQRERLGGGWMLTEFDVEVVKGEKRIREVMELADGEALSWAGWQYKQFVRVAGSPPHGTLVDPHSGAYRPGMCKLFSRPYPSEVRGELLDYSFDWHNSRLRVKVRPPASASGEGEGEVRISVSDEHGWGWGKWQVESVSRADKTEVEGLKRVEGEEERHREGQLGVRWWVESGWVEGSQRVVIRLGEGWPEGQEAEVVLGLRGRPRRGSEDACSEGGAAGSAM